MTTLPPEYLDPRTPADVIVTDVRAEPIDDPTVGEPLGVPGADLPTVPAEPTHLLVTVGDSLTHGVSSGAVYYTDLSWPALVAKGIGASDFAVPIYGGPLDGLPLNLEALLRQLRRKFGDDLSLFEKLELPVQLHRLLDDNEEYWERGDGHRPPRTDLHYENLGIYGWDVRDALSSTDGRASTRAAKPSHDSFLGAKPEADNDIAAHSVLAPFGISATQLDAAAWHGANGGIDTLVVALGANNALGAVVGKNVQWSDTGFDKLDEKGKYNVWRPVHFASEYSELVRAIRRIPARRVILGTVPHVTIIPMAKGINPSNPGQKWRAGSRYFPYYVDPWIDEGDFRPNHDRHLTHQQARAIDSAVDQFNGTIVEAVRHARSEGRDWLVFDLCGLLDGLAYRRYEHDADAAARNSWAATALPAPLQDLDSRFFLSDKNGRHQGGLFGLDGIHPTTSGYGVLAQRVLELIARSGSPTTAIDFAALRAKDTLNSAPPALVSPLLKTIAPFAARFVSRQ
jgi:lysophospholipase L1-like esterase